MGLGLAAFGFDQWSAGPTPALAQEEGDVTVDDRATRLRKRLGRLCRSFGFLYRHEFANGEMRPFRCSRASSDKTILVGYAFSDRRTKQAWLGEWGVLGRERGAVIVRGKRWTVEVLVRRYAREVRRRV
jgi:hypothetical protein